MLAVCAFLLASKTHTGCLMFLMLLSMCPLAVYLYFQTICLIYHQNFDLLTFVLNYSFGTPVTKKAVP